MSEVKKINIALLGLGTVGTGVYKVLKSQQGEMPCKIGAELVIKNSGPQPGEGCSQGG